MTVHQTDVETMARPDCSRCGFSNEPGAAFCGCCAAPLDILCLRCGTTNPPRFRFCGGCGARIETSLDNESAQSGSDGPKAERRQLTVMFCDLVGSTRLSLDLDPEELRELVRSYQTICARAVESFGGHIAQYLGDGVLVYFGYPVALENEADRAVRGGLAITREIAQLAQRWRHRTGDDLAVRVGIHTGLVVVGEVGSGERRENLALGGTPNIAARLQSVAEPNTVAISAVTQRLVSRSVECKDLGPATLRGVTGIGSVYRVVALREPPRGARTSHLIGRDAELALLAERWSSAAAGAGQAVTIRGDAGIGKSHLVDRFIESLESTDHVVIECRCLPYYQNTALYPIVDSLERELGYKAGQPPETVLDSLRAILDRDGLPVDEALPLIGALLELPGQQNSTAAVSPEAMREQTIAWLLRMIMESARNCPLVFIVEDLHWADPSTLDLLGRVVDQLATARILALFTTRPEFEPDWHRDHARITDIARLSQPDSERIVRSVAGKHVPDEVVRQIVHRTDGVPLFVDELTRMVLQSGLLVETEGGYQLNGPLPPLAIPATLQDSLEARLDRLAAVKEIAQIGATFGREFTYAILKAIAGHDDRALRNGLRQLVDVEMITEEGTPPDSSYAFKHALIQEAAYESLLRSTRQRFHKRIAETLERSFRETVETEPETLAFHYSAADLPAQAVPYWLKAGRREMQAWANQEAASHLRRGLECLAGMPASDTRLQLELELQAALGTTLIAIEGYTSDSVREAYATARQVCHRLGNTESLAPVATGLFAYHLVRLDLHEAAELADELTKLAEQSDDPQVKLLADTAQGTVRLTRGDLASSKVFLDRAIATYDSEIHAPLRLSFGHDIGVVAHAYMGVHHWFTGHPIQSRHSGEAAVRLARQIGHPHSLALALAFHGGQHLLRSDYNAAAEVAEELLDLAMDWRFIHWQADAITLQACILAERDQLEAAAERLEHARDLFRDRGTGRDPQYDIRSARVLSKLGRGDEAMHVIDTVVGVGNNSQAYRWNAECYHLMAELFERSPEREAEAEAWFRRSFEEAHQQGARSPELRAATSLARRLARSGRVDEAIDLLTPVYSSFTEGHELPDLRAAADLLEELTTGQANPA